MQNLKLQRNCANLKERRKGTRRKTIGGEGVWGEGRGRGRGRAGEWVGLPPSRGSTRIARILFRFPNCFPPYKGKFLYSPLTARSHLSIFTSSSFCLLLSFLTFPCLASCSFLFFPIFIFLPLFSLPFPFFCSLLFSFYFFGFFSLPPDLFICPFLVLPTNFSSFLSLSPLRLTFSSCLSLILHLTSASSSSFLLSPLTSSFRSLSPLSSHFRLSSLAFPPSS